MPLTNSAIQAAKPAEKPYKLPDANGLHLEVRPSGAKLWRYRYRIGGKENLFALGEWYPAGFDREWDLHRRSDLDIPDEEIAIQLLDPVSTEANDLAENESPDTRPQNRSASKTSSNKAPARSESVAQNLNHVWIVASNSTRPLQIKGRAVICGYTLVDHANVAINVEVVDDTFTQVDPARQKSLTFGQDIELIAHGTVRDHESDFRQLDRKDGMGRFFVEVSRAPGLDPFDREFLGRLSRGCEVSGKVMSLGSDAIAVSLPRSRLAAGSIARPYAYCR